MVAILVARVFTVFDRHHFGFLDQRRPIRFCRFLPEAWRSQLRNERSVTLELWLGCSRNTLEVHRLHRQAAAVAFN